MSAATALTLLDMVVRETTNPHEADNAKRQLARLIDRAGGAGKLFGTGGGRTPPPPPPMSFSESKRRMAGLEGEVADLKHEVGQKDQRISKLLMEVAKLKGDLEAAKAAVRSSPITKAVSDDGTIPYIDFSSRARAFLGNNWKVQLAEKIEGGERVITRANVNKVVPEEWLDILTSMRPAVKSNEFSPEQVRQIRGWARKGDDTYIAKQATAYFGTVVTPSRIGKLRTDLRRGNRQYGEKEYGGPLPLHSAQRMPKFVWENYADIELEAARRFLSGAGPSEIARYVTQATGLHINDNQINQRMYNSRPPKRLIADIATSGPLSVAEAWLIFKTLPGSSKSWQLNARDHLDLPHKGVREGFEAVPQDRVDELRQRYREHVMAEN